LGKFSDALNKYAKERKETRIERLPRSDVDALLRYDRQTGHLLQYNAQTGEVDISSMEVLRNQGTIQRLLDIKLISPSGQLTQKGLQECERLAKLMNVSESSAPVPGATAENDPQEEAVDPIHTVSGAEKGALLQSQVEAKETAAVQLPSIEKLPGSAPVQKVTALRTPQPQPPKIVLPPPEPADTPPLESKMAGVSQVEKREEAIAPEATCIFHHTRPGKGRSQKNP